MRWSWEAYSVRVRFAGVTAAARRDARLVRAIVRTGSRAKADTLVRAYYDEILRFALRQITSAEDARDVTQEIFVAELRGLPGFDPRRASFRTWLYRIASNKVIDWLRSSRSTSATVSLEELDCEVSDGCDEMGGLSELSANSTRAARIGELLCTYPDDVQRIVRLRVYAERPFGEIAEIVHMPEAAVKARGITGLCGRSDHRSSGRSI